MCFQLIHCQFDDLYHMCTCSVYHHRIGSMNHYPLFIVRSWNNGLRCMSCYIRRYQPTTLQWRHNGRDGVWNYQPPDCLLNRLLGRTSKKISKIRVTGLCVGNSPWPVNSPHKGPVARKMFPFDDVSMIKYNDYLRCHNATWDVPKD